MLMHHRDGEFKHPCLEAPIFFEAWWAIGLEDNTQENSHFETKQIEVWKMMFRFQFIDFQVRAINF